MLHIKLTGDFKQVRAWMRKLRRFLEGDTGIGLWDKLGRRMKRDFEQTVERGGTSYKGGIPASPEVPTPATWPKTHPRWQKLRRTGPQPLKRTGGFAKSFRHYAERNRVTVGSTHKGSRRFHFGDEALGHGKGNAWRWAAPVYNGEIMDEMAPAFQAEVTDHGAGHIRWFKPVIQKRGYLALWDDTVKDWWERDVGGWLGGSN